MTPEEALIQFVTEKLGDANQAAEIVGRALNASPQLWAGIVRDARNRQAPARDVFLFAAKVEHIQGIVDSFLYVGDRPATVPDLVESPPYRRMIGAMRKLGRQAKDLESYSFAVGPTIFGALHFALSQ